MPLVDLIIALALLEFGFFINAVAWARGKYKVEAPATTGDPVFERYFRVQMNTLEQLVLFVPGVWLFAHYISAPVAAALGALFIVGRLLYFIGYVQDPKKRSLGFLLSGIPTLVLVVGAVIGTARAVLHPG